jgi:superfamily I DNA and/or RNA helicase
MIGDHHQLPPVIKNMAFQKYSNMEQSLFTRFVRLGVPTVDLDAQGRARARWVRHTGDRVQTEMLNTSHIILI